MEWFTHINWADVLAIIIILRGSYVGLHRGIIGELFYIFVIWIAIIFGLHLYSEWGDFLNMYLWIPLNIANLLGFVIITCGIYLVSKFIYSLLPRQNVIKVEVMPLANRICGPIIGLFKGFAITTVFFLLLLLIPLQYVTDSAMKRSLFGRFFIETGTTFYKKALSIIPNVEPRSLTEFLEGAKPLSFEKFKVRRKDKLDEVLK